MTEDTGKKTFVVVGATGNVGRLVASTLQSFGHQVRPVARSLGVPFDHREKLNEAFSGAHGAYLMIPFDFAAPDLHRREEKIGVRLCESYLVSRDNDDVRTERKQIQSWASRLHVAAGGDSPRYGEVRQFLQQLARSG